MKESAREIKTSILSKLKEEERKRYEQVFDSDDFSQAAFEEKYLPLLMSSVEFLPRLLSSLLACIAIDSLPKKREELLVAYLRTWRPEDVISFHKLFYKDRKLLPEYGELGKIALFETLADKEVSTALNQLRKLRNISAHSALHIHIENFINIIREWNISRQFNEKLEEWKENPSVEAIREILSQVRQKLGKTIDDIEKILEDSPFTLTAEGEPAIRTSGREIRLSPLFTGKPDGYTLDLKTYLKKGEEKCTYTNGIDEELEVSQEINRYIDVAIKLRVEDMNYTGTLLKIGYQIYKSNNNKYSVRLEIRREEETVKTLWLEEETGEAEIDGIAEGEYTVQAVVVKKGEEKNYESAKAKEKTALEKAYASARFRIEEINPGKAEIKRIHDIPGMTLLENREDELKIEIRNTGNTKLEIKVGLEGYDEEHFEMTTLEEKLEHYQDKTVFLKIKAIRTESNTREYSLGLVKVSCCEGETRSNSPIHLKIEKNFNPGGFIDRKEQLDRAGEELDPQRRGEGIRTIWVSGEAGQGKTRFMRRLEELFDDKCAVVTLSWELEKEVDIVSFAERLTEELGKRLGWKTAAMNRLEGFRPQRREEIEEGARLAVKAISSLAKGKNEKVLLQIDDAHKVTTTDEGSHFMKKLIESMKEERKDIDVRCFIYTRKARGLGFVGENSLEPFESAQDRIELMELKEGAVEESLFENAEELVWGILTDVFKPEEFENIRDDFRRLLARKSGGNPLILQLLLERYFKEGAISWDGEKWIVRESKEKLGAVIPEGEKLKERLIIDKLHSYRGDGKKLIHLLGMLVVVKERDLKINGIGEATVIELEGRILEKGEDGYTFSHNLYSEYWEEEIGERALGEREKIEKLERMLDNDWGEGYREKLWRYISLEEEAGERLKSEREELEEETKELRRTLYTEGLSEERLRELNDSRAVLEAIGELSEKGWKNRVTDFRGDIRYGYWLMGTREKIEEEGEEKDTALEVISLVAGVINDIGDSQPDALYSLEFIQDGEYVVEKIFERGKERLEETGRIVPQAIFTIASAMVNRGNPKAARYYEKAIEVYDRLLESVEDEGLLNGRGVSLQSLAALHAGRGLYDDAEREYLESIASYDRAIELNENDAGYHSNRGAGLSSLADFHVGRGLHEEAEREYYDSIASFDRAIELNEKYAHAYSNRGNSLQSLAALHAGKGLYEDAEREYREAIASYDRTIELNKNNPDYHSNRGTSLGRLAALHAGKGLYEEAESEYNDSIESIDRAI
ncbi:MAG: hypothetical protein JW697_03720, partial [Kosmotogaceae bacterium]|nr:hypothetical protein [Kosmotogaceae bacterium]